MNFSVKALPRQIVVCGVLACLGLSCSRDWPPDTPEYKASARSVIIEEPEIVVTADASEPGAPPPQEKPVEKPKPAASKPAEAAPLPPKAEEPEQKKEEAAAPTLIGTWRVTGMSKDGQQMPGFDQIQMTLTFADGGAVTMEMAHPQMPQPQTKQGSWSVSGDQITISIENDAKTGKYAFEGNNKLKLEIDEATMELSRM